MEINWIGFVLACFTPTIVAFVYYSKSIFGNSWMQAIGMNEKKTNAVNIGLTHGSTLAMSALMAFYMLNFCNGEGQDIPDFDTFEHGAFHGLGLSLFIVIPVIITLGLFEHRKWKRLFTAAGYWLISICLMGGILDHTHHWGT